MKIMVVGTCMAVSLALLEVSAGAQVWHHYQRTVTGVGSITGCGTCAVDPNNNRTVTLDDVGSVREFIYTSTSTGWGPQGIQYPTGILGIPHLVCRGSGPGASLTLVIARSFTQAVAVFTASGGQWNPVTTMGAPTLVGAAFASMPNGDIIAFGGYTPTFGYSNATWRLAGTTWTLLAPPNSPPARGECSITSTPAGVVIFGGTFSPTGFNDIWSFDGVTWTQLPVPANGPSPRALAGFAFRPSSGEFTVTSGLLAQSGVAQDVWHLSNTNVWYQPYYGIAWSNVVGGCCSATDPVHDEVITVDNWHTAVDSYMGYLPFGQGCTCSQVSDIPFQIPLDAGYAPLTGGGFGPEIGGGASVWYYNAEPSQPVFLAWGTQPTGPVPAPGFPMGCNTHMANIVAVFQVGTGPTGFGGIPIANDYTLAGLKLVFQMLQFPAGGFGGCISNAMDVRIGAR